MSYDTIVVGAGISGAATAYHLRKAGAKTLLLERGEPRAAAQEKAPRSSARAIRRRCWSSGPRQHHDVRECARRARHGCRLRAVGYCFVVSADMLEGAKKNVAMQKGLGIVNEWSEARVFRSTCRAQSRRHRRHRLRAAWRLRRSGAGDGSLRRGVQKLGRRVPHTHAGAAADAAGRPHHRRRARQRRGERKAVVNAAGPWAKPLAASAGLDLPLRAVREQDTVWQVPAGRAVPKTSVSMGVDACFFARSGRSLHHRARLSEGVPRRRSLQLQGQRRCDFIGDVQTRVERRFPAFAGMKLIEAYAALYDVTPDWYPIVGPRAASPAMRTSPAAAGMASRSRRRSGANWPTGC